MASYTTPVGRTTADPYSRIAAMDRLIELSQARFMGKPVRRLAADGKRTALNARHRARTKVRKRRRSKRCCRKTYERQDLEHTKLTRCRRSRVWNLGADLPRLAGPGSPFVAARSDPAQTSQASRQFFWDGEWW